MKLEELPVEVLGQVLELSHSLDTLALYQSGSRLLASKLCRGGAKRILLTHSASVFEPRLPQCLQYFNLDSLHVSSISPHLGTLEFRHELKQLTGNLRTLYLRIPNAEHVIFGPSKSNVQVLAIAPQDDAVLPPENASHSETANADLCNEGLWNLDDTWPKLEELSVFSAFEVSSEEPLVRSEIFARLPRSLIKLVLKPRHFELEPSLLATLPKNLETLSLYHCILPHALSFVPSSVTDLDCSLHREAHLMLVKDPGLLPNLRFIPMEDLCREYRSSLSWILSPEGKWPENIEKLVFIREKTGIHLSKRTAASSPFEDARRVRISRSIRPQRCLDPEIASALPGRSEA